MHLLTEAYYELFSENRNRIVYLYLDEIRTISRWEVFVRRIHDSRRFRVEIPVFHRFQPVFHQPLPLLDGTGSSDVQGEPRRVSVLHSGNGHGLSRPAIRLLHEGEGKEPQKDGSSRICGKRRVEGNQTILVWHALVSKRWHISDVRTELEALATFTALRKSAMNREVKKCRLF